MGTAISKAIRRFRGTQALQRYTPRCTVPKALEGQGLPGDHLLCRQMVAGRKRPQSIGGLTIVRAIWGVRGLSTTLKHDQNQPGDGLG
jgi:hypothetical protein